MIFCNKIFHRIHRISYKTSPKNFDPGLILKKEVFGKF